MPVWPLLMALAGGLSLINLIASNSGPAKALAAVFAAYVTIRLNAAVFGQTDLYLPIGALIWGVTAMYVARAESTTSGGIIAASALCYYWAVVSDASRVSGSLPFIASDVLMVLAMVWTGWHGVFTVCDRALDLVRFDNRDCHSFRAVPSEAQTLKEIE